MTEVKYGLTSDGFRRKRLPEILDSINSRVADKLGVEIQTGSNSLFGQLHGIYAYEIADLWEQAENAYNAMYPNTASGTSLSNAAGLAGISMLTAEKSTIAATCYGVNGTAISYGSQISSSSSDGSTWSSISDDASISSTKACYAAIEVKNTIAANNVYTLSIDDKKTSYTAKSGDTASIILTALSANILESDGIVSSISNGVLEITAASASKTFSISATGVEMTSIGSPVTFQCDKYGAVNPAIGTINQIITSISGWTKVSNSFAATTGREAETDTSLRQRWISSLYGRAATMTDAIADNILSNVDGVSSCTVYENCTDTTDSSGRPPHSVEAIVDGGVNNDIAAQIWRTKSGGIDTYGSEDGTATDSHGIKHTMHFNRPENVKIWLKVTIGENPDETLSPSALQEIQAALLTKGEEQTIGEDVILQRYFSSIFKATTGVGYISLTATTGDTAGTYATDNISINDRQVALFDTARIEVTKQ